MNDVSGFNFDQLVLLASQTLENLESEEFRTVRRGYDAQLVKKRMREAAEQIRGLLAAVDALSQRVDDLESAADQTPELDAKSLTAALGDEAVRMLDAARITAEERVQRAEMECVEILEEARSAATEIIQEGRTQGRHIVAEAREVRERMLDDLAQKRRARRLEVEQLRAVRNRMLESLTSCRQMMDSLMTGLVDAMPHAAAAAERAGLRVMSEPEPSASQIEGEIEAARVAGLTVMPMNTAAVRASAGPAVQGSQRDVQKPDATRDAGAEAVFAPDAAESTGRADGHTKDTGASDAGVVESAEDDGSNAVSEDAVSVPDLSSDSAHSVSERWSSTTEIGVYDMEAETSEDLDDATVFPGLAGAEWSDGVDNRSSVDVKTDQSEASGVSDDVTGALKGDETNSRVPDGVHAQRNNTNNMQEPARSNVEDIFARLRSMREKFANRSSDSGSSQPGQSAPTEDDSIASSATPAAVDMVDSDSVTPDAAEHSESDGVVSDRTVSEPILVAAHDSADDVDEMVSTAAPAAIAVNNVTAVAGAEAVKEITRDLRRVLMDDQSELLDAIRRLGRRAVLTRAGDGDSSYAGVLREPLQRFVSEIDASIDDLDLNAAAAAIASMLDDPVRSRLRDLAEDAGNTDELSIRVRAVYKESRIRRAPVSAEAAFAAAWPELPKP